MPSNKKNDGEGSRNLLKIKLHAPKNGWKDPKGVIVTVFTDRHRVYRHVSNIFWQLREQMRDEANLTLDESNEAERAKGVKRANLHDPDDYDEKLAAMTTCESLGLGLNEIQETAYALDIMHKYNQAVVDAFTEDEYFGLDMAVVLKDKMGQAVKTF